MSAIRNIVTTIVLAWLLSGCSSLTVLPVPDDGTSNSGRPPPVYFAVRNPAANFELLSTGIKANVYVWRAHQPSTKYLVENGILEFCIRVHNKQATAVAFEPDKAVKSALGDKSLKVLTGNSIYFFMESLYPAPNFLEFVLLVLSGGPGQYHSAVSAGRRAAERAIRRQVMTADTTIQGSAYVHYNHYRELVSGDNIALTVNVDGERHRFLFCVSDSTDGCPNGTKIPPAPINQQAALDARLQPVPRHD